MFRMLAHASFAMQTAFSCLLVCLLEFYYRRVASEAWLRWFACSWVAQAAYVASLWIAFDDMSGGMAIRVAVALLGFIVPPTIALTSIALLRGRTPARTWIAALYLVGLAAAAITFVAGFLYPLDSVEASRIHNIPRHVCYGLASLLAAVAFARHGRQRHLTGSLVTAGAWAFFGLVNLARATESPGAGFLWPGQPCTRLAMERDVDVGAARSRKQSGPGTIRADHLRHELGGLDRDEHRGGTAAHRNRRAERTARA